MDHKLWSSKIEGQMIFRYRKTCLICAKKPCVLDFTSSNLEPFNNFFRVGTRLLGNVFRIILVVQKKALP